VLLSAPMASRWLTLLVVVYVTLDFGNPLMPGAVNFGPAESVDGIPVQDQHPPLQCAGARTPVPPRARLREGFCVTARRPPTPAFGERLVDVRGARSHPSEPLPATEDH